VNSEWPWDRNRWGLCDRKHFGLQLLACCGCREHAGGERGYTSTEAQALHGSHGRARRTSPAEVHLLQSLCVFIGNARYGFHK